MKTLFFKIIATLFFIVAPFIIIPFRLIFKSSRKEYLVNLWLSVDQFNATVIYGRSINITLSGAEGHRSKIKGKSTKLAKFIDWGFGDEEQNHCEQARDWDIKHNAKKEFELWK
jgi:hypothetical protein